MPHSDGVNKTEYMFRLDVMTHHWMCWRYLQVQKSVSQGCVSSIAWCIVGMTVACMAEKLQLVQHIISNRLTISFPASVSCLQANVINHDIDKTDLEISSCMVTAEQGG